MVHNETVYCKKCGKELAWWDMFTNIQFKEEWECQGKFKKRVHNVYLDKERHRVAKFIMDGGASKNKDIKLPSGAKRVKYEMKSCALHNHTFFCRECSYKLKFKCPICNSIIRKRKNKDGSGTKYDHGGW